MNSSDFASKKLKGRGFSSAPRIIYKNVQSGRSMIEMLGVLAIIGALSVGGIAGYSKAMMKYRINKTIEQITLIAGNIRTFFGQQKNYQDLMRMDVIKEAKLVPDEMLVSKTESVYVGAGNYEDRTTEIIETSFGEMGLESDSGGKAFSLTLNIPQEACIEIASNIWPNETFAVWIADNLDTWGSSNIYVYSDCNGSSTLSKTTGNYQACRSKNDLPIDIDDAINACTCATDGLCDIRIAYGK